jgi:endonuclease/exonuclease/phosphatase family metal-dependent hydrolase
MSIAVSGMTESSMSGRVAEVIAELDPDIVAMQELDVRRKRTGGVDQAHEIAHRLDMACHFHAALKVEEELYGDAILTAYPERLIQNGPLPGHPRIPQLEPRGALWVEVEIDGVWTHVLNTHLGLVPREQQVQASFLAGPSWLDHPRRKGPSILLGDFNATSALGGLSHAHRQAGAGATAGADQDAHGHLPLAAAGAADRPPVRQPGDRREGRLRPLWSPGARRLRSPAAGDGLRGYGSSAGGRWLIARA